jgi:hypothetical protein
LTFLRHQDLGLLLQLRDPWYVTSVVSLGDRETFTLFSHQHCLFSQFPLLHQANGEVRGRYQEPVEVNSTFSVSARQGRSRTPIRVADISQCNARAADIVEQGALTQTFLPPLTGSQPTQRVSSPYRGTTSPKQALTSSLQIPAGSNSRGRSLSPAIRHSLDGLNRPGTPSLHDIVASVSAVAIQSSPATLPLPGPFHSRPKTPSYFQNAIVQPRPATVPTLLASSLDATKPPMNAHVASPQLFRPAFDVLPPTAAYSQLRSKGHFNQAPETEAMIQIEVASDSEVENEESFVQSWDDGVLAVHAPASPDRPGSAPLLHESDDDGSPVDSLIFEPIFRMQDLDSLAAASTTSKGFLHTLRMDLTTPSSQKHTLRRANANPAESAVDLLLKQAQSKHRQMLIASGAKQPQIQRVGFSVFGRSGDTNMSDDAKPAPAQKLSRAPQASAPLKNALALDAIGASPFMINAVSVKREDASSSKVRNVLFKSKHLLEV